jgi:hypothetical protein
MAEPVLLPSEVWRLILEYKRDAEYDAATKIQAIVRAIQSRRRSKQWFFTVKYWERIRPKLLNGTYDDRYDRAPGEPRAIGLHHDIVSKRHLLSA